MAKRRSDLTKIGLILALISGIIAIVYGIAGIIGTTIEVLSFGTIRIVEGSFQGGIVSIIMGILLILIYQNRIKIDDVLALGIVVLVIGLLGGGPLAIIGGILIILDYFV